MSEFQPLIDQLYRERVVRARAQSPGERMSDVLELAEWHFGKDEAELRRRLRIGRVLDEHESYGPPQPRL